MLNNIAAIIGGVTPEVGDYESIQTVTVGSGGAADVTFSSIPQTYTHLQIRGIVRDTAGAAQSFWVRYNGDSTSGNYFFHYLQGNGSAASAAAEAPSTVNILGPVTSSAQTSGMFAATVIDILDYSKTTKAKTTRALSGYDANGSGIVGLYSGGWSKSNEAITSIFLRDSAATNFAQGTTFALYGIK